MKNLHSLFMPVFFITLIFILSMNFISAACVVPTNGMSITVNTKFCSGNYYLPNGIIIGASSITLDCNGAVLIGNRSNNGITISQKFGSVIKNCGIKNFSEGFRTWDSGEISFINNSVIDNQWTGLGFDNGGKYYIRNNYIANNGGNGIYLFWYSEGNVIEGNILENNTYSGITLDWGVKNSIVKNNIVKFSMNGIASSCAYGDKPAYNNNYTNNTVMNNTYGFYLCRTKNNLIENNNIINNFNGILRDREAFDWQIGINDTFYHNNFINNNFQTENYNLIFNWDKNNQGNYWSNYDEAGEGCIDADNNNICDSPYVIDSKNKDNYPLTKQNSLTLNNTSTTNSTNQTNNNPSDYNITKVIAGTNTEYRLYYKNQHFMSIINASGAISIRPHPGVDVNGWGSSWYMQPFLPGATLKYTNFESVTSDANGINLKTSGLVSKDTNNNYGTWKGFMNFKYNPSTKEVTGNGTYNITLSSPLSSSTGDLNLYKLASNYLTNVPLLSGGFGDTGDMHNATITGTGYPGFIWDPKAVPTSFPGAQTDSLSIDVSGDYYNLDSVAQGYARIEPAYKPSMKIILTSKIPNIQMIFGGIYDTTKSQYFWEDNIGITPLILKTSTQTQYAFDVQFSSKAPINEGGVITIPTNPRRPTINWAPTTDATWYHLWINKNGVKYQVTNWTQGTNWTSNTDLAGGTYDYWVQSWNSQTKNSPWSQKYTFVVPKKLPEKTTILSPSGTITTTRPTLSWQKVNDTSWYSIWINKNGVKYSTQLTQSTSYTIPTTLTKGNYEFWVRTWNVDGYGAWSNSMKFTKV